MKKRIPKPGIFRKLTASYRCLPDFVVIGAQKSGTTSMYRVLNDHPRAMLAFIKEVKFFDIVENYAQGINFYRSHFPLRITRKLKELFLKKSVVVGEDTPRYICVKEAPARMKEVLSNPKLIVMLRNPVDRAYSHYNMARKAGHEECATFREALDKSWIDYKGDGIYHDQLQNWFKYFPREQFLIIKSENYFKQPEEVMKQVYDFLGIEFIQQPEKYAPKRPRKYEPIDAESKKYLSDFYKEHNQKLYKLLGEDYNW